MNTSISSKVTSCVNSLIRIFQENPLDFLYEREIQAILYSNLKTTIRQTVELPVVFHRNRIGKELISINIMRAEYPGVTETSSPFDIAIIHPDSRRRASREEGHLNDAFWNQNLMGAIELKYCQIGNENNLIRELGDFWRDIEKLKKFNNPEIEFNIQFRLALLFIQSFNESMYPVITQYLETKHLKPKMVTGIDELLGMEAYIVTQPTIFKVEGLK